MKRSKSNSRYQVNCYCVMCLGLFADRIQTAVESKRHPIFATFVFCFFFFPRAKKGGGENKNLEP